MRIINCYYIKGKGKDSKCIKIKGVGIVYNVSKSMIYCKGINIASSVLTVSPIGIVIGIGIIQGFISGYNKIDRVSLI